MRKQNGFSLVELAVTLVIIGLLIGGVLKGQEIVNNSRVTMTVAKAKEIDAAMRNFRTIYGAIPGDMKGAGARIPDCNENCNPWFSAMVVSGGRAGDGEIGDYNQAYYKVAQQRLNHPPNSESQEEVLFWQHLLAANLLGGYTNRPLYEANLDPAWGVTHPAAAVGGGFIIGSGSRDPSGMIPDVEKMFPFELTIIRDPKEDLNLQPDRMAMTPLRAAWIDRKLDDGYPVSGDVKGIGVERSCFHEVTEGGGYSPVSGNFYEYDETIPTLDCGVVIRIQN